MISLYQFRLTTFVFVLLAQPLFGQTKPDPDHAAKMEAGLELFKAQIRPLLEKHCFDCHGGKATKADVDVGNREALVKGELLGKSAAESRLYRSVAHLDEPFMPKKADKLPAEQIAHLARWIELGAPYDRSLGEGKIAPKKEMVVTPEDRNYWAFRPLQKPAVPNVNDRGWPKNAIDNFIRASQEKAGLTPAAEIDRRGLIRRVSFDLVGLPPEPAEVEAFVAAKDFEGAYAALVDRLLASPHYGERWARHWLDAARYGESHGFEHDYDRPNAYPFRDFVIKALNQDMPFDQFLRWQLAGDELAPKDPLALAATGFLAAGVYPTQITNREAERIRYDAMDDMLATTGNAMLGLTVGCARCHDHKYDPIPTRDYYAMLSAFTTTVRAEVEGDFGPPDDKGKPKRIKMQVCTEGVKPMRHHTATGDIPDFYPKTFFLKRGDVDQKDGEIGLGVLQVLCKNPSAVKVEKPAEGNTSGRRSALANWLTDVNGGAGALAARVAVNRIWHHHFGRGLVSTVNDFGSQGEKPSHPELLEWLAADFANNGWSPKRLHRQIVLSRTYRLGNAIAEANAKADPENRLLTHRPPRRLEAEIIRDNLLAVSGRLDETMYGPGTLDEGMRRRSIYFQIKRSRPIPFLQVFDWPDSLSSAGVRPNTVTAPQALAFLNSPHVRTCAAGLASQLKEAARKDPAAAVALAYNRAFGRLPTDAEARAGAAFIERAKVDSSKMDKALTDYALILMSLNEFVFVK